MYTNAPNNCEIAQVYCCVTCYLETTIVATTIKAHTTNGVTVPVDETIQSTTPTADEFGKM